MKILNLGNLPPKCDVTNWLNSGGTVEQLKRLAAEAQEWTPEIQASRPAEIQSSDSPSVQWPDPPDDAATEERMPTEIRTCLYKWDVTKRYAPCVTTLRCAGMNPMFLQGQKPEPGIRRYPNRRPAEHHQDNNNEKLRAEDYARKVHVPNYPTAIQFDGKWNGRQ